MDERWTLTELVEKVAQRIAALPPPRNGQVRAVPDERTVRYYGTIGLVDPPVAMRGRTALYGHRHLAQIVAIKRLQSLGRSLAEIQALWPTLDDDTLARMTGVALGGTARELARSRGGRKEFWKRELPAKVAAPAPATAAPRPERRPLAREPENVTVVAPIELRIELVPGVVLALSRPDDAITLSAADVRAIRATAAPLITELARRQLITNVEEEEP